MAEVSQVPRAPLVTGAVPPPASVIPEELQPVAGLMPSAHSRRKSWKLGPVAVPTMGICVPGLNSVAPDVAAGGTGLVIARPGGIVNTAAGSLVVLLKGLVSPPPATDAVFTTTTGALAAILTLTVIGG